MMNIGKTLNIMLVLSGFLSVVSCAPLPSRTAHIDRDLPYALPKKPWTGPGLTAIQQVELLYEEAVFHLQAVVDLQPGSVKIVLLNFAGNRAIDILWTEDKLDIAQAKWVPETVRAQDILAQIVVAFWPAPIAEKGLPSTAKMKQHKSVRKIMTETETLVVISYDGDNPWNSTTQIDHVKRGVYLKIKSSLAGVSE